VGVGSSLSKCKALSSNSSAAKKKKKDWKEETSIRRRAVERDAVVMVRVTGGAREEGPR
jgi:hypothetical protein